MLLHKHSEPCMKRLLCPLTAAVLVCVCVSVCACLCVLVCLCVCVCMSKTQGLADNASSLQWKKGHENRMQTQKPSAKIRASFLVGN